MPASGCRLFADFFQAGSCGFRRVGLADFLGATVPTYLHTVPTCLWFVSLSLRVEVKVQRLQPYLIPSCTVSLCRATLSVLVELYEHSEHRNLKRAPTALKQFCAPNFRLWIWLDRKFRVAAPAYKCKNHRTDLFNVFKASYRSQIKIKYSQSDHVTRYPLPVP